MTLNRNLVDETTLLLWMPSAWNLFRLQRVAVGRRSSETHRQTFCSTFRRTVTLDSLSQSQFESDGVDALWPSFMRIQSHRKERPIRVAVAVHGTWCGAFRRRRAAPVPAGVGPGIIGAGCGTTLLSRQRPRAMSSGWRWCSVYCYSPVALCQDTLASWCSRP